MTRRIYKWRKQILMAAAALPLFQAATCDPTAINGAIAQQFLTATVNTFLGSIGTTLSNDFPAADSLQLFLGGNRTPFYTGKGK